MTTLNQLSFTERQVIHVESIDFPEGQMPLWDIINRVLLEVYTSEELKSMGQGVTSKVNSIIRKVEKIWVVNHSLNLNPSTDHNWSGETYLWVSDVVSSDIERYVRSLTV